MAGLRVSASALAFVCIAVPAWSGPLPPPVSFECASLAGVPNGTVTIVVSLQGDGEVAVAGTQNDFNYDKDFFQIEAADCQIDPAIGEGTPADKTLSTSVLVDDEILRNIVVSLANVNPIPSGPIYTCTFDVAADTPLGNYILPISRIIVSDPEGNRIEAAASNCELTIVEATPTPTPPECEDDDDCPEGQVCVNNNCVTPTPSPTPIGFCNDNDDCPEGQVCVDNRCVTVTPTPIGFCTDNDDCPPGQICVDNRCVTATPTPTPIGFCTDNDDCPAGQVCVNNMCVAVTPTRGSGGGGGCSCEIDPREHPLAMGDAAVVLLPALALAALRRRRRGG